MNKHIEVVKKWLADKDSVSQDELEDNADAARAAEAAAEAAANCCCAAADADAYEAADAAADEAAHWVEIYEELNR